jgi:hypothetical protein
MASGIRYARDANAGKNDVAAGRKV